MRQVGKVGLRRAKGMKRAAPIVCERAGGRWCGFDGDKCVGSQCELCGKYGWWYPLAHIQGRGVGGHEEPWNLANLCLSCHNTLDHADHDTREQLREKLREKTGAD
jgi:hypothetical protein